MKNNPRVSSFIDSLPAWQKNVCERLRKIIHDVDPSIEETIKRTDRPYFTLSGNICALQSTKDHINLFIYDPIAVDPENVINQGQENLTARSLQIYENTILNERGLHKLLRAVVDNNKVGGWRTITKTLK